MDHLIRNLLKRTRRTVPEHQTKATFAQKVLVSLLIVGNISLASLIWVRSHAEQDLTVTKAIPSALLLDDHLIQSKLFDLAAKSSSRKAVMVMLVSASTSCANLTGCMNKQKCGMRGTPNGCVITCQDETVITCPKGS
jgi:hypothetical protein